MQETKSQISEVFVQQEDKSLFLKIQHLADISTEERERERSKTEIVFSACCLPREKESKNAKQ